MAEIDNYDILKHDYNTKKTAKKNNTNVNKCYTCKPR